METTLSYLRKQIEVLLNAREIVICGGGAKDFAHYRQMVGERTGLNLVINEINDLQKRLEKLDGDD